MASRHTPCCQATHTGKQPEHLLLCLRRAIVERCDRLRRQPTVYVLHGELREDVRTVRDQLLGLIALEALVDSLRRLWPSLFDLFVAELVFVTDGALPALP